MTKRYAVHNLRCAGCAARIEDAIAGLPGVKSAAINLDSARLRVEGEQPELAAMIRLADAIEPGTLFSEMDENEPLPESSEPQPSLFRSEYKLWIAVALFAVGMIFEERLDALLHPVRRQGGILRHPLPALRPVRPQEGLAKPAQVRLFQ